MKGKGFRRLLGVVVGVPTLGGVGAASTHYPYKKPNNEGFRGYPTVVALLVLGGAYLTLAEFQSVGRIRSGHPGYHHWAGKGVRLDRYGGRSYGLVLGSHDPLQRVKS